MSVDLFAFQQSEIFQRSQCFANENTVNTALYRELTNNGYRPQDPYNRMWHGIRSKIVICFVDDISIAAEHPLGGVENWFDPDTTVITDNILNQPVRYTMHTVPSWYRGIYSYTPEHLGWRPSRDFHLSINRASRERIHLLIGLIERHGFDSLINNNHINFNAYDPGYSNLDLQDYQLNFSRLLIKYQIDPPKNLALNQLVGAIPIRTHNTTPEQATLQCWVNVVVETYVSDAVISLSEKTFRALVTPQPWVVQGSNRMISYLEGLGFDTLTDVVGDYRNNASTSEFIELVDRVVSDVRKQNFEWLCNRCLAAARHNRNLLRKLNLEFRQQWRTWVAKVLEPPKSLRPVWDTLH